jgi:hypothetical protein
MICQGKLQDFLLTFIFEDVADSPRFGDVAASSSVEGNATICRSFHHELAIGSNLRGALPFDRGIALCGTEAYR